MTLREMIERRVTIAADMRAILATAGDSDLPEEHRVRFDALRAEADTMQGRIERQAVVDDLDRRAAGQPVGATGDNRWDAEIRNFSVVRALAGAAGLPGVDAAREREISAEVARRSGRAFEGVAIPLAALETRVVTTSLPAGGPGSNIIATNVMADQTIDRLRASLVVRSLGATVLSGLTGNVAIPRVKADATAYWVAENAGLTASDPQIDQVSLSPKHVGAITEFSRNLLLQSSPDVEQLVRGILAQVLAQGLDQAAIAGTGASNQPRGVLSTSGIGTVAMGTNGAALTFDAVADLQGAVADANAEGGSMAFLTNTKVRRAAAKLKDSQNRPLGLATVFQGLPTAYTNNVPSSLVKGSGTGLSALLYGNWADLLIGLWSEIDVLVNPYESTAYPKGNVQVRAMTTCDISVRHPESFAAITDIVA